MINAELWFFRAVCVIAYIACPILVFLGILNWWLCNDAVCAGGLVGGVLCGMVGGFFHGAWEE